MALPATCLYLFSSFGMSASETFGGLLIASTGGGCIGLAISALIGERVERRTSIVYSAVLFCVAMFVLYHRAFTACCLYVVGGGLGCDDRVVVQHV